MRLPRLLRTVVTIQRATLTNCKHRRPNRDTERVIGRSTEEQAGDPGRRKLYMQTAIPKASLQKKKEC